MSDKQIVDAIKRLQNVPETKQSRYRIYTPSVVSVERYVETLAKCVCYDVIELLTAEKTYYDLIFYDRKGRILAKKYKCEFRASDMTFYVSRD